MVRGSMGNKEKQEQSELLILDRVMDVARAKGGEARRNVDKMPDRREAFGEFGHVWSVKQLDKRPVAIVSMR